MNAEASISAKIISELSLPVGDGVAEHPWLAMTIWTVPATLGLLAYVGVLPSRVAGIAAGAAVALVLGATAAVVIRHKMKTCPYLNP